MSDSKLPDAQSGAEKGYNHALVGNAGANLIYEAAGMQASLLGFCLESLVIDNDIIGATLRTIRGIEVNDDVAVARDHARRSASKGRGTISAPTRRCDLMQRDYFYPDRSATARTRRNGREHGRTDIVERAMAKVEAILGGHFPRHLAAVDRQIRDRFPIRLPEEAMRPGGAEGAGRMTGPPASSSSAAGRSAAARSTTWRCAAGPTACCWR